MVILCFCKGAKEQFMNTKNVNNVKNMSFEIFEINIMCLKLLFIILTMLIFTFKNIKKQTAKRKKNYNHLGRGKNWC